MKKRNAILTLFSIGMLVLIIGCGQHKTKEENATSQTDTLAISNDSTAIIQAFEQLKTDKAFLRDVGLQDEKQFSWNDHLRKIIRGDLNGDGNSDALFGFSIEGRGGGNNFDLHYAVFLNQENSWKYAGQLDANIFAEDRFFDAQKIENAIIKGDWVGIKDESLAPYSTEYIFKNGQIINSFTALHKTENVEREYLNIQTVFTSENVSIPLMGNVKGYEQLLGNGKIITPTENPDCGTYWEEGRYRLLEYPNFRFELNDENKAVLVEMQKGFRLQTDKGTIDENTKLQNLKNVFYHKDSWMMLDLENGLKTFAIPDGAESDNQWRFSFDKNGKLISVLLFVPC